ncbi:hypothetical protein TTHERM_000171869 (macronuclear) [Tetrahymena thermophila SB210]|uniref:Transmembrane protein n=1 Tax=Tetrahymena thermophila (strain SB210) TaxID=312017 RepID=W7XEM5_TETTS|nr:hypothetical protein TTHERM_000171869 [Tetrahymena thermophila SB210]EWS76202.1 hypothetical protein TTHERM_000171869 [Tetrahymena thermophila SB210]|eukprot:XP_012651249.1 hypothetical protein TTHERM_000171869 [Tetrahymena thermophila SB210]
MKILCFLFHYFFLQYFQFIFSKKYQQILSDQIGNIWVKNNYSYIQTNEQNALQKSYDIYYFQKSRQGSDESKIIRLILKFEHMYTKMNKQRVNLTQLRLRDFPVICWSVTEMDTSLEEKKQLYVKFYGQKISK